MEKYNYGGVKPTQREPLPIGKHHLVITGVEEGFSKGGNEMVTLDVTVDDQDFNKTGRHYITFLPPDHAAAGITLHFLKSIGEPHTGEFEPKPQDWLGKRFVAVVEQDEKNPKYNKIRYVFPPEDGIPKSSRVSKPAQAGEKVPF